MTTHVTEEEVIAARTDEATATVPALSDPQPGLRDYLSHKRAALLARRAAAEQNPRQAPNTLRARATAEGRSGVRRIQIREHQILTDSPLDFAGYNLGPSSPELQLGVLASCLTHVFLIQAADLQVPLDDLGVEISAVHDPRAGRPGFEDVPVHPHDISYQVHITSPASRERVEELYAAVERSCPILSLLTHPQQISGELVLTPSGA